MINKQSNDLDEAADLEYSRALVDAALTLPVSALPMAYGMLEALDEAAIDASMRRALMYLLRRMGNTAPTPALPLLKAALRAGAQPGARWDAAQCSPEWRRLQERGEDAFAVSTIVFVHALATANLQRLERAQALSREHVQRAQSAVDAAACAAS